MPLELVFLGKYKEFFSSSGTAWIVEIDLAMSRLKMMLRGVQNQTSLEVHELERTKK